MQHSLRVQVQGRAYLRAGVRVTKGSDLRACAHAGLGLFIRCLWGPGWSASIQNSELMSHDLNRGTTRIHSANDEVDVKQMNKELMNTC